MPDIVLWALAAIVVIAVGGGVGYFLGKTAIQNKVRAAELEAEQIKAQAEAEQKDVVLQATKEAIGVRSLAEDEIRDRRREVQRVENRINQKEENLDRKTEQVDRRDDSLSTREKEIEEAKARVEQAQEEKLRELERIASLTTVDARDMLLKAVEQEVREDANRRLMLLERAYKEDADRRSREIIIQAIQGITQEVVAESTTSVVPIPSDDMKGRIIGREGRNIRALENATGVDIIIDDTPDCVTLS